MPMVIGTRGRWNKGKRVGRASTSLEMVTVIKVPLQIINSMDKESISQVATSIKVHLLQGNRKDVDVLNYPTV